MKTEPEQQELEIIDKEESTLNSVITSLNLQLKQRTEKMRMEELRARELTSQIVASTRVEDKAMLASDEAVSHGMRSLQKDETTTLKKILHEPYFARLVVEEEINGKTKEFEYKIGLRENSECRIIDWKKAPIAKLFYEYKEGEEYSEEILGKERYGTIKTRNKLEIKKSNLLKISCTQGDFIKEKSSGKWIKSLGHHSNSDSDNTLQEVASLLSAEQYSLIQNNLDRALLVQGIAGSGKTTIALHRLAWVVAGQVPLADPHNVLALVLTQSLKTYISDTLPKLGISDVKIQNAQDWFASQVCQICPNLAELHALRGAFLPRRPETNCPTSIERLKKSMAFLHALDTTSKKLQDKNNTEIFLATLANSDLIISFDDTKLISRQIIKDAFERANLNFSEHCIDKADDPALIRIYQNKNKKILKADGNEGLFDHVFLDEAQDFSPIELAVILGSAKNLSCLTVIGDTGQKIDSGSDFLGWDSLKNLFTDSDAESQFVTLKLSYRSTVQIMSLANYIQGKSNNEKLEGRQGRKPIWFKCFTEARAISTAQDWLSQATDKYPTKVTAVACRTSSQARDLFAILKGRFHNMIRLCDSNGISFEAGIIVADISQLRGLEFTNLLLWNPSSKDYLKDDLHKNMLYLAITRARENVSIVTWQRQTSLLPSENSALIRFYDYASEEIEQASN